MSAIAGGLAVAELLGDGRSVLVRIVGIVLILWGTAVCGVAWWRYRQLSDVLESEGMNVTPMWMVSLLVGGLMLAALLLLVLLVLQ